MFRKFILYIVILIISFSMLLTECSKVTSQYCKGVGFIESAKPENVDIQQEITKYMTSYSKSNTFSGTVFVSKDDDVLLNRGYGMANYDKGILNTPETIFEIASLTKQFTATAILMLQEKKMLSVQDPISKYISSYPNGDKIKIFNLLTNTSGIPEYTNFVESIKQEGHSYTPKELVELFNDKSLNFKPGTSYEYSNSNYILLGYIIEKVSKMKYEDYIKKYILEPLKMNETGFLSNKSTIKNIANGYSQISDDFYIYKEAIDIEGSLQYAAGGICSTNEDLYRWEEALCNGKIISQESLNQMLTPNLKNYAYGWRIYKNKKGDKVIYHGGNLPGFSSYIERNLNKKSVIIILSNQNNDAAIDDISSQLSKILESS